MTNIETGGNIGFGGKPNRTPYLGFGITAEQHTEIMQNRRRPLTDGPIGSVPHVSNPAAMTSENNRAFPFRARVDQIQVSHLDKRRPHK